jgi:diadenylate cyclase
MQITDIIDILLIAFVIYEVMLFIRKTNSTRVAQGIVILLIILWLSAKFNLTVTNFLIRKTVELGLIGCVIIFQPELRRALEKVGSGMFSSIFGKDITALGEEAVVAQTVLACDDLSKTKTGALIIFERDNPLNDQINTGTIINADVTAELLKNIFYPKAPLHDGAVIIRDGRIAAAGCMLPLSGSQNLSRDLGMRHRAGIGMSERSDAVVVIVSEETGSISVAVDGMLKRHLTSDTFEKLLTNELVPEDIDARKGKLSRFAIRKKVKNDEEADA